MNEKDDDIAHPGMLSNPKNTRFCPNSVIRHGQAERRRRSSLAEQTTEKPKELQAQVEAALADVRLAAYARERCYIPGVNLDSDDPQAHAGNEPRSWMW